MQSRYLIVLSFVTLLSSCGKDSGSEKTSGTSSKEAPEAEIKQVAKAALDSKDPCELLTADLVRKHLELPAELEINQRLSQVASYPHCSYSWSTMTPEEEREHRAALAKEAIARASKQGTTESLNSMALSQVAGQGSAHLTTTKELDSEEAALSALQSARTFMENREKSRTGYDAASYVSPFVDVTGVGAKAHYSKKQMQLSLVYGKRLYHLGVSPHTDRGAEEAASAIAKDIFK